MHTMAVSQFRGCSLWRLHWETNASQLHNKAAPFQRLLQMRPSSLGLRRIHPKIHFVDLQRMQPIRAMKIVSFKTCSLWIGTQLISIPYTLVHFCPLYQRIDHYTFLWNLLHLSNHCFTNTVLCRSTHIKKNKPVPPAWSLTFPRATSNCVVM